MDKHEQPERKTIWTTNGMQVPLRAISETYIQAASAKVQADYRIRGEPVDPPTYTVKLAGGSSEIHSHDETTLVVTPDRTGISDPDQAAAEAARQTAENQAAWKLHLAAKERMEADQAKAINRAILDVGLDLELPSDESWIKRQRRLGIDVPDDPDERRYHWLTTEVLVTNADLMDAIQGVTTLIFSGTVQEEDIAAAMATFRSRIQATTHRELAARGTALEAQSQTRGTEGGEGLGADPEPVEGAALR